MRSAIVDGFRILLMIRASLTCTWIQVHGTFMFSPALKYGYRSQDSMPRTWNQQQDVFTNQLLQQLAKMWRNTCLLTNQTLLFIKSFILFDNPTVERPLTTQYCFFALLTDFSSSYEGRVIFMKVPCQQENGIHGATQTAILIFG